MSKGNVDGMPGKASSPEQIATVVALREAGYTVAMIVQKTMLSASTINRIIRSRRARKGTATEDVVNASRTEVRRLIKSKDAILEEAALMIADDLAQARQLRERILLASEYLSATNLREAGELMRAAAAMSTALKNTSDMVRHSLGYEKSREEADDDELPVIQVLELPENVVTALRENRGVANAEELLDVDTRLTQS